MNQHNILHKRLYHYIALLLFAVATVSCSKEWLDKKSDKSQVIPEKVADLQALLDNSDLMNKSNATPDGATPGLGQIGDDDYYILYPSWSTRTEMERNSYIWAKEIYNNNPVADWTTVYKTVYTANVALDGLKMIDIGDAQKSAADNVRGSAYFYRAIGFYNIAQIFAPPYKTATAATDLGIPLRLSADATIATTRSTLKQTYQQIIDDLTEALKFLPNTPLVKTRPAKHSAHALLARLYLIMGDYPNALKEANNSLSIQDSLMDYNQYSATATFPFKMFNPEVLFYTGLRNYSIYVTTSARAKVDTMLYRSYSSEDLRKGLYFTTTATGMTFKGYYAGATIPFAGLATDEVYLIKAEAEARTNKLAESLATINKLTIKRYKSSSFTPITATSTEEALDKILLERRKELLFRGIRWTDLRRLNLEPKYQKTLTRVLNGQNYTLPPNDNRYTYPLPKEVIDIAKLEQNPR